MRKVQSADLDVFDVMSIKASSSNDFFIGAISYDSSNRKLAFVKIPTTQSTPSVTEII
jgi:hypothetical protein